MSFPLFLLILGALTGVATAVMAFFDLDELVVAVASVTAVIAIGLTYIIARRQDAETDTLKGVVQQMHELLKQSSKMIRELTERESEQDYEEPMVESNVDSASVDVSRPLYAEEAITALRSKGASLDFDALEWRAKEPMPPMPGNHGWFVESPGSPSGGRWFVRKARGMTVRKAMPREFLDALENNVPLDPRRIKLDYQIKEHGLAAWYARTYDGDLWKVWRPNRDSAAGVRVEKVEDE